jgi:hypothetical protein
MPAKSPNQRAAFGMAYAARKGELDPKTLRGAAKHLYDDSTLSKEDLADFARKPARITKKTFANTNHSVKRG